MVALRELLHDFNLDLLYLRQSLPLPVDQMIELLVQMPNFQFGLEIDPVIIFRA